MRWEDYYKTMLALTAWREARGEDPTLRESMRAVMHVVRNRVEAKWGDWDHVITQKWAFSSLTDPKDHQLTTWPDSPDAKFELAMNLAEEVYSGLDPDLTGGATFYGNVKLIDRGGWFEREVVAKMRVTAQIGRHTFYSPTPALKVMAATAPAGGLQQGDFKPTT